MCVWAASLLFMVMGLSSCGSGPKYAEYEDVKTFVLWNCVDYNWVESLCYKWQEDLDAGRIKAEGYEIPEYTDSDILTLSQECVCWFRYCMRLMKIEDRYDKFDLNEDFDRFMKTYATLSPTAYGGYNYTIDCIKAEPERAELIGASLYFSFQEYFKEYANEQVKVLSWEPDLMNTGDLFSGYTITYEVDGDFYALATLMEYDSEDKYEIRIENKSSSLIELNQ